MQVCDRKCRHTPTFTKPFNLFCRLNAEYCVVIEFVNTFRANNNAIYFTRHHRCNHLVVMIILNNCGDDISILSPLTNEHFIVITHSQEYQYIQQISKWSN